ncbi:MAG: PorP/SprF family type IX secretion system membrane protein [Prevotellaceae bacterium]|jgi:type IX secretion system PorP/SprF family membrane protein|nr:PorP/SprF family type IX secretion system membrane protein [Prevotellaceae bacterium]
MKQSALHKNMLLFSCALCLGIPLLAQDVVFLQPYSSPLALNPAYTGSERHMRIGVAYQHQLLSAEPSMASTFYADYYFDELKSGVGISAVADMQGGGMLTQTSVGASYAYNLRLAQQTFLRFGIQALADVFLTSASRFIFPDNIGYGGEVSASEAYASEQRVGFDMALGGVFTHRSLYVGLAVRNLLGQPSGVLAGQTISTPLAFTLHGGYNIRLSNAYSTKNSYLSPNVMYCKHGEFQMFSAGANFLYRVVSLGAYYRKTLDGASFFILGAAYSPDLFTISYHFGYGSASANPTYSSNIHEVALSFRVKYATPSTYRNFRQSEAQNYNFPRF